MLIALEIRRNGFLQPREFQEVVRAGKIACENAHDSVVTQTVWDTVLHVIVSRNCGIALTPESLIEAATFLVWAVESGCLIKLKTSERRALKKKLKLLDARWGDGCHGAVGRRVKDSVAQLSNKLKK